MPTSLQMPTKIVMISDMQFNAQVEGNLSVIPMIAEKYERAGYKLPTLVYWNVGAAKSGNSPFTAGTAGAVMVSGFSPAILKGILSSKTDAIEVMLDTVGDVRYNYIQAIPNLVDIPKPKRKYVRKVKEA